MCNWTLDDLLNLASWKEKVMYHHKNQMGPAKVHLAWNSNISHKVGPIGVRWEISDLLGYVY